MLKLNCNVNKYVLVTPINQKHKYWVQQNRKDIPNTIKIHDSYKVLDYYYIGLLVFL